MPVVYLYGFASAPASHKAGWLQRALAPQPFTIADYPSHRPDAAIARVSRLLDEQRRHGAKTFALIGSSLGGYYSQYLAATRDDIRRVVLINPALDPQPALEPWIGRNTNLVSDEPFDFTHEDWSQLSAYDVPANDITTPTLLLLDEGDEIIPCQQAATKYRRLPGRTMIFPGGSHAFEHLDAALPAIRDFIKA